VGGGEREILSGRGAQRERDSGLGKKKKKRPRLKYLPKILKSTLFRALAFLSAHKSMPPLVNAIHFRYQKHFTPGVSCIAL